MVPVVRNRLLVGCFMFVCLTLSVAEHSELAEELPSRPVTKGSSVSYDAIPGFALKGNGKVFHGQSKDECEARCTKAPYCKSYSYNKISKFCVISQSALTYDPSFVFKTKERSGKGYRSFPGMTFTSKGWLKSKGKSLKGCIKMCDKVVKCKSLSYRNRDRLCLLSSKGIHYKAGFTYYEKNKGRQKTPLLVKPKPPPPPPVVQKPVSPTHDPALVRMELKEKVKTGKAKLLVAKAKHDAAKAKAKVASLKVMTKKGVADALKGENKELKDMESKFDKKSTESFQKQKDKAKLKFAESELVAKKRGAENKLDREKERGEKAVDKVEARTAATKLRAGAEAQAAATIEVKKIRVAEELKATQAVMSEAAKVKAKSKAEEVVEKKRLAAIKEKEKKRLDGLNKEYKGKKKKSDDALEVTRKKDRKTEEVTLAKQKEKTNKNVKELQKKDIIKSTERGQKNVEKATAIEKATRSRALAVSEMKTKDTKAADKQKTEAKAVEKETAKESGKEETTMGLAKATLAGEKDKAKKQVFDTKMGAQQKILALRVNETQKLEVVKRVEAAKVRATKARAMAEARVKKAKEFANANKLAKPMIDADKNRIKKGEQQIAKEEAKIEKDRATARKEKERIARVSYRKLTKERNDAKNALEMEKTSLKEIVSKAKDRKMLTEAKAAAKGTMMKAAQMEKSKKTVKKEELQAEAMAGLVRFKAKADVAAYVDSGPGKQGLHYQQLLSVQRTAHSRVKRDEKTVKAELKIVRKSRSQYHTDLHSARQKYHTDNRAAERASKVDRGPTGGRSGGSPMVSGDGKRVDDAIAKKAMAAFNSPQLKAVTDSQLAGANQKAKVVERDAKKSLAQGLKSGGGRRLGESDNTFEFPTREAGLLGEDDAAKAKDRLKRKGKARDTATATATQNGQASGSGAAEKSTKAQEAAVEKTGKAKKAKKEKRSKAENRTKESAKKENDVKEKKQKARAKERKNKAGERTEKRKKADAARQRERKRKHTYRNKRQENRRKYDYNRKAARKSYHEANTRYHKANRIYSNSTRWFHSARSKAYHTSRFPANVQWGRLPQMAARQGYLQIQRSYKQERQAFVKFPLKTLRNKDTIAEAELKLFKYGGLGGPAIVKISSCQWERSEITYTNSRELAKDRVSSGITSKFPDEQRVWVTIKLKPDLMQNARVWGDHVCLQITGGASNSPTIISSEMSSQQAPELILRVKEQRNPLKYGNSGGGSGKKKKKPDSIKACRERIREELTTEYTKKQLEMNKKEVKVKAAKTKAGNTETIAAQAAASRAQLDSEAAQETATQISKAKAQIIEAEQDKLQQQLQSQNLRGASRVAEEAKLAAQAKVDVAKKAAAAEKKIERSTEGQLTAMKNKEKLSEMTAQAKLKAKIAAKKEKSASLTPTQIAKVKILVNTELAKRIKVCAKASKTKPAEEVRRYMASDTEVQMLQYP